MFCFVSRIKAGRMMPSFPVVVNDFGFAQREQEFRQWLAGCAEHCANNLLAFTLKLPLLPVPVSDLDPFCVADAEPASLYVARSGTAA